MRRNAIVVWLLLVSLMAQLIGCGGGGSDAGGGQAPDASMEIETKSAFLPYEVATAKVSSVELSETAYEAQIGGIPVTLLRLSADTLAWMMPDLPPGTHALSMQVNGQPRSATFNIVAGSPVVDSDGLINEFLFEAASAIDNEIMAVIGVFGEEETLRRLEEIREELLNLTGVIAGLSYDDKEWLAKFLSANLQDTTPDTRTLRVFNEQTCWNATREFTSSVFRTVGFIPAVAIAVASGVTGVGAVAAGIAIAILINKTQETLHLEGSALNACLGKIADELLPANSAQAGRMLALAGGGGGTAGLSSLLFKDHRPSEFHVVERFSILNSTLKNSVLLFKSAVAPVTSILPAAWVDRIMQTDTDDRIEAADPASYSIADISNTNITVAVESSGEKLKLTFKHVNASSTVTPFTFRLVNNLDGGQNVFSAALSPSFDGIYRGTEFTTDGYRHDTVCVVDGATISGGQHFFLINDPSRGTYGTNISGNVNLDTGAIFGSAVINNQTTVMTTFSGRLYFSGGVAICEWATAAPDYFGHRQTGYGRRE